MTERLRPCALHPQLRPVFRFVPNPPVQHPLLLRLMQAGSARVRAPRRLPQGMRHGFHQLGPGAGMHVFTPAGARERAGVLWIHGAGFIVGSAAQDHARCARLARDLDVVVYSAEYRLAPGAPFPAPLDDLHAVWRHLLERAGGERRRSGASGRRRAERRRGTGRSTGAADPRRRRAAAGGPVAVLPDAR